MPDGIEDFFAKRRSIVEKRIREQLARRARIDPHVDCEKVVNIQIDQEKERLERRYDEFDEGGPDRLADAARVLIDDWLPDLATKRKRCG